ncbi:MAG: flagellar protein FlgN [Planctomycetes bacterium]|nr:flagellar protein FlgN [Planctomycetota bacterium]
MSRTIGNPAVHDEAAQMQIVTLPTGVEAHSLEAQVGELLEALSALHEMLKQLLELARAKLVAMRAADAAALQRCAARECGVLERVFEQERRRDAVLARLAQSLHWDCAAPPRLSEIAGKLPEPFSSRLRAKTAGLRQTANELRRENGVAAEVARHLHKHIRAVVEDIARVNQESVVYGPSGKHEQRTNQTWVDAVG